MKAGWLALGLLAVLVLLPLAASAADYPLPVPYIHPSGMVVTADGAVWVSTGPGLYRLDRGSGTFAEVNPRFFDHLLVGRDGAVWATGLGSLFRIDPADLSEQAFPFPGETLTMMAAGPDGMIWLALTGSNAHRVVRITPAGDVVSSVASVEASANEAGGDLVTAEGWWWLSYFGGPLRLIEPDGTSQSFPIAVPFARWLLSAGDFLWVIGQQGDVARVGLNGAVIARYKPAQSVHGVAVDTEGDLWFREGDQLFQLTRDGVETTHNSLLTLPCPALMASFIAFGPGGELVVATGLELGAFGVLPCPSNLMTVVTIVQPSHAAPAHEVPAAGIVVLIAMAGTLALAGVFLTRS